MNRWPPGRCPCPLDKFQIPWHGPRSAGKLSSACLSSPTHPSPSHTHALCMLRSRRKTHLPLQKLLPPALPFILYLHAYSAFGTCQQGWEAFSDPPPNPGPESPFQAGAPSALSPLDDHHQGPPVCLPPPACRSARARPVPDSSVSESDAISMFEECMNE